MSTAMLTCVELTDDMLRAAWADLSRHRAHWPGDYGLAMQHPLISRLVRIEAALRTRQQVRVDPVISTARPQHQPTRPTPTQWAPVDRKRAAAGDRDD